MTSTPAMEGQSSLSSGHRPKYSTLPDFRASLTCGPMGFYAGRCSHAVRCLMAEQRTQRWWRGCRGVKSCHNPPPVHIKSTRWCDFAGQPSQMIGLHSELLKNNSPMCRRRYRWTDTKNYKRTLCLPGLPAQNVIYMLEKTVTNQQPVIQKKNKASVR